MNQYQYEDEFFVKAKKYTDTFEKYFLTYPLILYCIVSMIETMPFGINSIRNQILVYGLCVVIYFYKFFSYQQFKRITMLYFYSVKSFFIRLYIFLFGAFLLTLYFFVCSWYLKSNIVCASFCFNSGVIEKIFIFASLVTGLFFIFASFLFMRFRIEEERNVMREKNILL